MVRNESVVDEKSEQRRKNRMPMMVVKENEFAKKACQGALKKIFEYAQY